MTTHEACKAHLEAEREKWAQQSEKDRVRSENDRARLVREKGEALRALDLDIARLVKERDEARARAEIAIRSHADALSRAETAETERDQVAEMRDAFRKDFEGSQALLKEHNAALGYDSLSTDPAKEPPPPEELGRRWRAVHERAEVAEADNAAHREVVRSALSALDEDRATDAMRLLDGCARRLHPGAALLEELRRLRELKTTGERLALAASYALGLLPFKSAAQLAASIEAWSVAHG